MGDTAVLGVRWVLDGKGETTPTPKEVYGEYVEAVNS
jgi:hypothetical protein